MTEFLAGVHPQLRMDVLKILNAMMELGHPMIVTDTVRTVQRQSALYAQGRTAPGRIVTAADGVVAKSNHQAKADGYGHAVDVAFLVNGRPAWPETAPWPLYGLMAKTLGLKWGGDWKTPDRPHIELPS